MHGTRAELRRYAVLSQVVRCVARAGFRHLRASSRRGAHQTRRRSSFLFKGGCTRRVLVQATWMNNWVSLVCRPRRTALGC